MISDALEMAADIGKLIKEGNKLGMIIGPCVGYIIQTKSMIAEKSAEGFSPYVSFILILSNILRIYWWQVEHFSNVILYASILMVFCQLVLLYFWVTISN